MKNLTPTQRIIVIASAALFAALFLLQLLSLYLEFVFVAAALPILTYELLRRKNRELPWDYFTVFSAFYLFLYLVVPYNYLKFYGHFYHFYSPSSADLANALIIILLGYLCAAVGYRLNRTAPRAAESYGKHRRLIAIGIALLLLGVTSLFIYASIYGGIVKLYQSIDQIRSGYFPGNSLVFVRKFIQYTNFGAWLLISYLAVRPLPRYRKVGGIAALTLLSVVATFATGGRLDVFLVLVPVCFGSFIAQRRNPPAALLAPLILLALLWFSVGDYLFSYLSYDAAATYDEHENVYFALLGNFIHPFNSLIAALQTTVHETDYRVLNDLVYALQSLLPERLLGIRAQSTVTSLNTMYLTGKYESTIPPGMLGYFYYAFGIPGIMVLALLFGWIVRAVETFFARRLEVLPIYAYLYAAYAVCLTHYMMSGDPRIFLQTYFWLYTATVLILLATARPERFGVRLTSHPPPYRFDHDRG